MPDQQDSLTADQVLELLDSMPAREHSRKRTRDGLLEFLDAHPIEDWRSNTESKALYLALCREMGITRPVGGTRLLRFLESRGYERVRRGHIHGLRVPK